MKINNFGIGMILGVVAPILALVGFYIYQFDTLDIVEFFHFLDSMGITMQVLSFCSMPSFLIFFIFYYINYNRAAQGVVGATLLITIALVLISTFG